jgi:hypothetical protein
MCMCVCVCLFVESRNVAKHTKRQDNSVGLR